jgi:hypothetical protein
MGKVSVAAAAPAAAKKVMGTMSVRDDDGNEEGYYQQDESREAISQDIDDFERRLHGERITPKVNSAKAGNPPSRGIKINAPPLLPPKAHVKVKPTSMTEDEEDRADDIRAVGELDRFEQRLPSHQ